MKFKRHLMGVLRDGEPDGGGGGGGGNLLDGGSPPDGGGSPPPGDPPGGGGDPPAFSMGMYDGDGNLTEAFSNSVHEDYKGVVKHAAKYKSEADFIKGTSSLLTMAKRGEVGPLADDAPEHVKAEHLNMIRKATGVPDTAADYAIALPEGFDESTLDKEVMDGFKKAAHDNNMTPAAANEMFAMAMAREAAIHQSYQDKDAVDLVEGGQVLAKLWGDDAPRNIAKATAAIKLVDADLDMSDPAFKHPTAVRLAHKLAELTGDDSGVNAGSQGQGGNNFREQSKDIVGNVNNPWHAAYHNAQDPKHDAAVKEKTRLTKLALQHGQK
jgi:hypothetical protein